MGSEIAKNFQRSAGKDIPGLLGSKKCIPKKPCKSQISGSENESEVLNGEE